MQLDLTNRRFGMLLVIRKTDKRTKDQKVIWECQCDCGNITYVNGSDLKRLNTTSCGCYAKNKLTTHGMSHSRLYSIWHGMKDRCYNKNHIQYYNYGGRGISVCDDWLNDFVNFYDWSINNGYKENLTIDRINNNGDYTTDNCRWTTMKVQSNNQRTNHLITYNNETHTIAEWSDLLNIKRHTLNKRINNGWTIERAFGIS